MLSMLSQEINFGIVELHRCLRTFARCTGDMFLVFQSLVHQNAKDLTSSFAAALCPLMIKGYCSRLHVLGTKCMMAVFPASKVAPLLLSYTSACLIIVSIPARLIPAVGPVIRAINQKQSLLPRCRSVSARGLRGQRRTLR